MTRTQLARYLHLEIIGGFDRSFSLWKLWRRASKHGGKNYVFWFRIAQYLHSKKSRIAKSLGKRINRGLMKRYSVEIMLGVEIGEGFWVGHPIGIVVNSGCVIGKNFALRQNTTIGTTSVEVGSHRLLTIGDNVSIGANSCVVGSGLRIGSNVTIGAMSFVNKDVPDNSTYITVKEARLIPNEAPRGER